MARLRSGMVKRRSSALGSTVMRSVSLNNCSNSERVAASIAVQSSSSFLTSKPPSAAVFTVLALYIW